MKNYVINTFKLNPQEAHIYCSAFSQRKYLKNEEFIGLGTVCHKVGFVEKGSLKCVFAKDGHEAVDDFVFENQFVSNYYSFLTESPSTKRIICLEDTIIWVTTREKLYQIGEKHSFLRDMARQTAELLFLSVHRKFESLRMESPESRYIKLLNSDRNLINKVPLYEIASYLNVSPETVSRIRKRIS